MNRIGSCLVCALGLAAIASGQLKAQSPSLSGKPSSSPSPTSAPAASATRDYSNEPFVIEHYVTSIRFENDGTCARDLTAKIRVQNDAGAEQLKNFSFAYNSAIEQADIRYVRVRKSSGAVTTVSPDSISDAPLASSVNNPAYADEKEKHIAIPMLEAGDTLEYDIAAHPTAPLARGQFWFQQDFIDDAIVLDEQIKINVPLSRIANLKSPDFIYETAHMNGRTIYLWKHVNLVHHPSDDPSSSAALQRAAKPPSIMLTTFSSWQDVSRWYASLYLGPSEPTVEVRALAERLTRERTTQIEKIQALYDYISKNIRYVDIALGKTGYTPHSAAGILANKSGDSKDENVLLAALLRAINIPSQAVLIPYIRKLDVSLPSPSQFDHVITAVPQGNDVVWLDPTTEVAPFRLLISPLRNKSALAVSADGSGKIVQTPADPPFLSTQRVEIEGHVSDLGKLTATIRYFLRGDTEFVLRRTFRTTPEPQWTQLAQTILTLDGVHGVVTAVKPGDPTDTRDPFELEIQFVQPNFVVWSAKNARVVLPMLTPGMPDLPEKSSQPIELGSPLNITTHLTLALPARFTAQPPVGIAAARDYAEFKTTYRFEDHTVTAERTLNFKMRELPPARAADYQAFTRSVTSDENQPLRIENPVAGDPLVPASASPDELLEAGTASLESGSPRDAIPLFQRAVELAPAHKQAWNELGLGYMRVGRLDDAVSAFRKQCEINPADEHCYEYLGVALQQQKNFDDAAAAYRKQIEVSPIDPVAHGALGGLLLAEHRYADAIPELSKAAVLSPDKPGLQISLGEAYLNTGQEKDALDAFQKGVALAPTPAIWNDVAVLLANHKVALDQAQQYATLALTATSARLQSADFSRSKPDQWKSVATLGILWNTLGLIHFHKGDLDSAERYANASWQLNESGESVRLLGQICDRQKQKDRAIHMYALALAVPRSDPEARALLTLLLGGNVQIDGLVARSAPEIKNFRSYPAGKLLKEDAQADFLVALSPAGKKSRVDAVQFLNGSAKLRPFANRLRTLDYGEMFPDPSAPNIIRRGTLSCFAASGDCTFTLIPATDAALSPN